MSGTVFCVDIGTTALKAALIDSTGTTLSFFRKDFMTTAAQEWYNAFLEAAVCFYRDKSTECNSICISGNGPTLVSTTQKILLWNHNIPQTGPSLFTDRIKYFKDNYTEDWNNSPYLLNCPEHLIYELTDKAVTILPEPRFTTAYWTSELLEKAGLTAEDCRKLGPFVLPGTDIGKINRKTIDLLSKRNTILPEDTHIFAGAPDFISALAGTDTLSAGKACDRAGSSEGINLCTTTPWTTHSIRTLPSITPGLWNEAYLIEKSGTLLGEAKKAFETKQNTECSWDDFFKYATTTQGPEKQTIDGLCSTIKQGLEILERLQGCKINSMTVTGSQAQSDVWNQYKADYVGIDLVVMQEDNAELLGNAIITLTARKHFPSLQEGAKKICRAKKTLRGRK